MLNNVKSRWLFCAIIFAVLISGIPAALAAPGAGLLNSTAPKGRVAELIDDNDRVILRGSRHPATLDATDLGRVDDALRLDRMILSLTSDPEQTAALENFLRAVHEPASASYGQWLTPQGFEQHFGASVKDIDALKKWLTRHGFQIDEAPAGGRTIIFSGSVADVRKAFQTEIHRYTRNGEAHIANASEVQLPRALASVVSGVVSLHDFRRRPMHVLSNVAPAYTVNATTHYLAAGDISTIYNLNPLYVQATPIQGSGRSIAILGRSNVDVTDITTFRSNMNLPANPPQIIFNGADPGYVTGDETESDLDLEWAGATAPAATIKFVTSASTYSTDGIDRSASYAVSNNVADVISLSYGSCEQSMGSAGVNYYNNLWQQAAAQGMTVLVSSGDSGAAGCDLSGAAMATGGASANGLCTSPYSTCVGGTQFADTANPSQYWASGNSAGLGSALSYIPEMVWNESGANGGTGLWASGGGASIYFAKPSWQVVAGVPADGKRDVPDVSMTAAMHDGYLLYTSDNATRTRQLMVAGGTSASAPAFAGIMALVNQKTGSRQGNANARLYGLAAIQAGGGGNAYFHAATSGNNSVPGQAGFAANAATSYNQATGLGSVDGNVLVTHWMDSASTVTVSSSSPFIAAGQGVTFTATVTGASPSGTVQFRDGAGNLGSPVNVSAGVAMLPTNLLVTAGSHSITAVYSGDSNNASSISAAFVQTVTKASSAVGITSSAPSVILGQSVTFTATVTGISPAGAVQFVDGAANIGAPMALNSGVASLTSTALGLGSHSITAAYSGDSNNLGSTSSAITQTVTAAVVGNGGDSDAPTLPEWGVMQLALLLMMAMWKNGARRI